MSFWNRLKDGIQFENSDIIIPWNTTNQELFRFGDPKVHNSGGHNYVSWINLLFLDGLKGAWTVHFFPDEKSELFKSIGLEYRGDKESIEAYERIKKHLLEKLGNPIIDEEIDGEKTMEWRSENNYVHLYFFEMHVYHCSLHVGLDRIKQNNPIQSFLKKILFNSHNS